MSDSIQFHLDECVPPAVAQGLRLRGIGVSTSNEEDLLGIADEEQLAFAAKRRRVLVTQDADFLRIHRSGREHLGIVYYDPGALSLGGIIKGLILVHGVLTAEEMVNQVEFL